MQEFLNNHPSVDQCYARIYEEYLMAGEKNEAKIYFKRLCSDERFFRSASWMLARLYACENDSSTAMKLYENALHASVPVPNLLFDYIRFDKKYSQKCRTPEFPDKICLTHKDKIIFAAYVKYVYLEYNDAINLFNSLPKNITDQVEILYKWSMCFKRLDQVEKSISLLKRGLSIAKKCGNKKYEAQFFLVLGGMGKYYQTPLGFSYYDSAYTIANKIGDYKNLLFLSGNRAIINRRMGNLEIADIQFRETLKIAQRLKDSYYLAKWYSEYGHFCSSYAERYDEALRYYDLSGKFAKQVNYEYILIRNMIDKGNIYYWIGHYNLAENSYKKAINGSQQKNISSLERYASVGLAKVYFEQKKYNEARKIYKKYINSDVNEDQVHWLIQCGMTYKAENNFDSAKIYLLKALKLSRYKDKHNRIWALIRLAEIDVLLFDFDSAENKYKQCLELVKINKDINQLPNIYMGLGDVLKIAGKLEKAISNYQHAADLIENTRGKLSVEQMRIEYFADASVVYNKLIECYYLLHKKFANSNYIENIYLSLEKTHSRTLRELQSQNNTSENILQKNAYIKKYEILEIKQRQLRELMFKFSNTNYDNIFAEIDVARKSLIAQRLRLYNKTIAKTNAKNDSTSLENLIAHLQNNKQALLMYHIGEKYSFCLCLSGNNKIIIPLPTESTNLDSLIQSLIYPFHNISENNIAETKFKADIAHRIYEILIKPIEEQLELPTSLIVIPGANLTNLPFELLLVKKPDKREYTAFDVPDYAKYFLTNHYSIIYSPSGEFSFNSSSATIFQPTMLVFANPTSAASLPEKKILPEESESFLKKYPDNNSNKKLEDFSYRSGWCFDPLPFSEVEAKKIKDLFSSAKLYTRSDATTSNFLKYADQFDIIHIATHGLIDTSYDVFSGLIMSASDNPGDDGILMGYEISDLNLNCDLVTLCACETALGRTALGEGVLGLPRLFLSAGAKSVLMTMWKVDDRFTALFTPKFYDHFLNKYLSKAESLTQAKRDILNLPINNNGTYYQHPIYWASFVLYGDAGSVGSSSLFIILFVIVIILIGFSSFYFIKRKNMT